MKKIIGFILGLVLLSSVVFASSGAIDLRSRDLCAASISKFLSGKTYLEPVDSVRSGYYPTWMTHGCTVDKLQDCIGDEDERWYSGDHEVAGDSLTGRYIYSGTQATSGLILFEDLPSDAVSVNRVKVFFYAKEFDTNHDVFVPVMTTARSSRGHSYEVAEYSSTVPMRYDGFRTTIIPGWYSVEMVINPQTGRRFTVEDVNFLKIGVDSEGIPSWAAGSVIYKIKLAVDYETA